MKTIIYIVLVLFLMAQPAFAADSQLLVTTDKALNDKWYKVRGEDGPALFTNSKAFTDQEVSVGILYANPGVDANGRAKILFDLKIVYPDGNSSGNPNIRVVDAKLSNTKVIRLGEELARISFHDPGRYAIQATVKDIISGKTEKLESTIDIAALSNTKYFQDNISFKTWLNNYYQRKPVEKIIDGIIYFSHSDKQLREKNFFQIAAFFGKVLDDNQYMVPYLLDLYPQQDSDTKFIIMCFLPYINYDLSQFIGKLSEPERTFYFQWEKERLPYPVTGIDYAKKMTIPESIKMAYLMDMLWGNFFASGEYEPVRRLVDCLELGKFKGGLEKYKQTKAKDDEENAARDMAYQAARWSIKSNVMNHQLVRNYCDFIYENEQLSPIVRQELKEILGR